MTKPQSRPTTTTSTTTITPPTNAPITTIEQNVELIGEIEQQTTHRPPINRPWWSEYHTQRPEQQQSCKQGSYQASKENCQNYYLCKNGRYKKYSCKIGSQWNRYTNKCDTSRNANCNEHSKFCIS